MGNAIDHEWRRSLGLDDEIKKMTRPSEVCLGNHISLVVCMGHLLN